MVTLACSEGLLNRIPHCFSPRGDCGETGRIDALASMADGIDGATGDGDTVLRSVDAGASSPPPARASFHDILDLIL